MSSCSNKVLHNNTAARAPDSMSSFDSPSPVATMSSTITSHTETTTDSPVVSTTTKQGTSDAQRLDFLRKRNAKYSKKKYYKKKREVKEMHDTVYDLADKNSRLRRENDKLERLLVEAQEKVAYHNANRGLLARGHTRDSLHPSLLSPVGLQELILKRQAYLAALEGASTLLPSSRNLVTASNPRFRMGGIDVAQLAALRRSQVVNALVVPSEFSTLLQKEHGRYDLLTNHPTAGGSLKLPHTLQRSAFQLDPHEGF